MRTGGAVAASAADDRVSRQHITLFGVVAEQMHSFGAGCSGQHRIQGRQRQRVSHGQFEIGCIIDGKPVAARQGQNAALVRSVIDSNRQSPNIAQEARGLLFRDLSTPFIDDERIAQLEPSQSRNERVIILHLFPRLGGKSVGLIQRPGNRRRGVEHQIH